MLLFIGVIVWLVMWNENGWSYFGVEQVLRFTKKPLESIIWEYSSRNHGEFEMINFSKYKCQNSKELKGIKENLWVIFYI